MTLDKALAARGYNAEGKNKETLQQMFEVTIPNTYFASLIENEEIAAVGLGVAQGEYIGMFNTLSFKLSTPMSQLKPYMKNLAM